MKRICSFILIISMCIMVPFCGVASGSSHVGLENSDYFYEKISENTIKEELGSSLYAVGQYVEKYAVTTTQTYRYAGSREESGSDKSGTVTIRVKIYYDRTIQNGKSVIFLTNVYSYVSYPSPARMSVTAASLQVGQTGWTASAGYRTQSQSYNVFGSGDISSKGGSTQVTPPSSWIALLDNGTPTMGANITITLINPLDGKTWTANVACNY